MKFTKINVSPIATFLLIVLYFLAEIALLGYVLTLFSLKTFGVLPFSQILFHLSTFEFQGGLHNPLSSEVWPFLWRFITLSILLTFFLLVALNTQLAKTLYRLIAPLLQPVIHLLCDKRTPFIVLSLFALIASARYIDRKLHIVAYLTRPESTWFEKHYAHLDLDNASFNQGVKKNLIIIFLESMEMGYRKAEYFQENLIPELVSLEKEGIVFRGYQKTPGALFTIDGLSAQLLGVPVISQGYDVNESRATFLSSVPSIFNLLAEHGYVTSNFSGVTGQFTAKRAFFKNHGIDECHFEEDWIASGHSLNKNTRGTWGFNDAFLWKQFKIWLSATEKRKQPFATIFETVDTHQPNGWTNSDNRKYGDLRDAIKSSSKQTYDFIQWAKQQSWYPNTVIVIVGDHPWQDPPNSVFSSRTSKLPQREIYNLILNASTARNRPVITPSGGFTAMDLAPTYLSAMGIRFSSTLPNGQVTHTRLGLGTDLFSGESTLIEKETLPIFLSELNDKYSFFYQRLFWNNK